MWGFMKKVILLGMITVIFVACLLSVPSRKKHEQSISIEFKKQHAILGKVGAGTLYPKMMSYKNFYILSVMVENQKVKSVGVVGLVFVL